MYNGVSFENSGPGPIQCTTEVSKSTVSQVSLPTLFKWLPMHHECHYYQETKPQSMEWRHNGSLRPAPPLPAANIPSAKTLGNFSPQFYEIKTAYSSLITFQMAELSTRSITHHWWCKWRTFWTKNTELQVGHQGGLVLALQCPGSPGTGNSEETGLPGLPLSWSPNLFSRSGPVGLPPVS
jgi:hypothetical protein